ncbi:hypothetical protein [Roseisolibacter agri]|uniref:Uncharacterized protein n=1 Tax=Roseisolibacter agri TaxID=2014610 RepID=A0AA37V168_9BACT|nr:hypothetical protein [Roseisolibacter agri]GLC25705.1 hypothetical protein rosag_22180 [Roseisolibacter agri]
MPAIATRALLAVALLARSDVSQVPSPAAATLAGDWELSLARTHYGPGVDRRRRERFTCTADGPRVACTITGERADGRRVTGRFTAAADDVPSSATGVPGIDAVRLRAAGPSIVDATFLLAGRPVFGYRAYRPADGRTLVVVTVDPVSRAALTTVVVYDRR